MPSASDIRVAIAEYLEEELEAEIAGLSVETRYRNFRDVSRKERREIMGTDLYYLEVLPAPEGTTASDRDIGGTYHLMTHAVEARLWYAYTDADALADSSQPTWNTISDALIRSVMRAEGGRTADGLMTRAQLQQAEAPTFDFDLVNLGAGRRDDDLAHQLTATITVRENSRSSAG